MNRNEKSGYSPLVFSEGNAARLRESKLRVVVTGASRWLGQASLEMLESALGDTLHSRVVAFASRARPLILRSGREIALESLEDLPRLEPAPTLLLHYAFLGQDRALDIEAEEYVRRNAGIRKLVGEAMQQIQVTHLLLSSSGAVYGLPTSADRSLCPDPVRNPYGTQKILDEEYFLGMSRALGARMHFQHQRTLHQQERRLRPVFLDQCGPGRRAGRAACGQARDPFLHERA